MKTPSDLLRNIQSIDTTKVCAEAIDDTKAEYLESNKGQMLDGYDSTGEKIRPKYKNYQYAKEKNQQNPRPGFGFADLRLTGSFQDAMKIKLEGVSLEVESTDEKSKDLEKKYGENIYHTTGVYRTNYLDQILMPNLKDKIKSKL